MYSIFKYRLYPTQDQKVLLEKHFGCCRFVYNLALETKLLAYSGTKTNITPFDLVAQLPELKKESPWLREVCAQSLQVAIQRLDYSFSNFFKGKQNFPKFKKKSTKDSYCIPQRIKLNLSETKLIIPKFQEGIKITLHRKLNNGIIKQCLITKTSSGKFFTTIFVKNEEIHPDKKSINSITTIGIDLGIKDFLTLSNGKKILNPKFLRKNLLKLKFLQKKFSKFKGKRIKRKIILLHEKVRNQREDFLHKTSTNLVKNHETICIESLNIKGLLKNHNLALSISDLGWGNFISLLKYKSDLFGVNLIKINRFDPSSKTCSNCGFLKKDLKLNDRNWLCLECSTFHDRDINAAINIKNFGLNQKTISMEDRFKNQNELSTVVEVMTSEININ